jgi:hypothetical protein
MEEIPAAALGVDFFVGELFLFGDVVVATAAGRRLLRRRRDFGEGSYGFRFTCHG